MKNRPRSDIEAQSEKPRLAYQGWHNRWGLGHAFLALVSGSQDGSGIRALMAFYYIYPLPSWILRLSKPRSKKF